MVLLYLKGKDMTGDIFMFLDLSSVMKKIFFDEAVLSVFIGGTFLYGVTILEGKGHDR